MDPQAPESPPQPFSLPALSSNFTVPSPLFPPPVDDSVLAALFYFIIWTLCAEV
jgi:hypothetical protein